MGRSSAAILLVVQHAMEVLIRPKRIDVGCISSRQPARNWRTKYMRGLAFPTRKTDDARRADVELVLLLEQMARGSTPITARAVVRRMTSLSQAPCITRDR